MRWRWWTGIEVPFSRCGESARTRTRGKSIPHFAVSSGEGSVSEPGIRGASVFVPSDKDVPGRLGSG